MPGVVRRSTSAITTIPGANAAAFTADGWFRTGDIGYVDGNGNLVISGRSKELVNRGGKKFHPREIEEILYACPKVLHVAIVRHARSQAR